MTLSQLLEQIPQNKRPSAKQLIRELNFQNRQLTRLRKEVADRPLVEHFQNGKQSFDRESVALKQYNATVRTFNSLHKSLIALLPDDVVIEEDEFDRWLSGEDIEE